MIKIALVFLHLTANAYALSLPKANLSESLQEQKQGNEFLQIIWDTDKVIADVETQVYLKKIGNEMSTYSEDPAKHVDFLMLNDASINAFAGPYGYIGVHTGMLLSSDSESELAGVLSHELSHITQNHLARFSEKTDKQTYIMVAGMLAAALVDNSNASQAIAASTVAGTAQQNINFTREHEWEADRIGTTMLSKSGFDPSGMAHFFEKLKDDVNAQEFLRSHPLSINRVSDAMQRSSRLTGDYRADSFEYQSIKARLYYHQHGRIKLEKDEAITLYMQAYDAFEEQKYNTAQDYIEALLKQNQSPSSHILAGRIYSKLGQLETAQQHFSTILAGESAVYYSAKAYFENKQTQQGIHLLRRYLKKNSGTYQSHKLLSSLYVVVGSLDRAHIHNAKALVLQGKLEQAIERYERAKTTTRSQDLFDIIGVEIERLEKRIDLYKELP
jgi:predicted Zn-dependent protease